MYVNANGDILGFNMFAYCSNNPVMFIDPSGEDAIVLPAIGVVGLVLCVVAVLFIAFVAITMPPITLPGTITFPQYEELDFSKSKELVDVQVEVDVEEKDEVSPSSDVLIYRYGDCFYPDSKDMFTFNENLMPGVSFSLTPPISSTTPYSVTTLNTINNSGVFTAVIDGKNHVSVRPTGVFGSIESWYYDGENHPYTHILRSLTQKVR